MSIRGQGQPIPVMSDSDAQRFHSKVGYADPRTGCMPWLTGRYSTGYGQFWLAGAGRPAHRVAYTLAKGAIPVGMVVDHLCRNLTCCNPMHLEAVTIKENTNRGVLADTQRARHAARTHCKNGHPFTADNTYAAVDGRRCRACRRVPQPIN